jgi:hypothetical protein
MEDGTCHVSLYEEDLEDDPGAIVSYWFEGTHLFLKSIDTIHLPDCGPEPAVYEVELRADGTLRFRTIKDSCRDRVGSTAGIHARVP